MLYPIIFNVVLLLVMNEIPHKRAKLHNNSATEFTPFETNVEKYLLSRDDERFKALKCEQIAKRIDEKVKTFNSSICFQITKIINSLELKKGQFIKECEQTYNTLLQATTETISEGKSNVEVNLPSSFSGYNAPTIIDFEKINPGTYYGTQLFVQDMTQKGYNVELSIKYGYDRDDGAYYGLKLVVKFTL